MKSYSVRIKLSEKSASWDDINLIVFAADFGNAEDKALRYIPKEGGWIESISFTGEATEKHDVVVLKGRS